MFGKPPGANRDFLVFLWFVVFAICQVTVLLLLIGAS